jgi:hypothetical protein
MVPVFLEHLLQLLALLLGEQGRNFCPHLAEQNHRLACQGGCVSVCQESVKVV